MKVGSNIATVDECIELVRSERPDANGMTYISEGSKDCYAEIKASRIGPYGCSTKCQTCIFTGRLINADSSSFMYLIFRLLNSSNR